MYFMTSNGQIRFVCPLNVEVLPKDFINSRLAKVLQLLWSLTCLHYRFHDL